MAAKRATVPKFGTWDNQDAGYTVYFEQARQGKGAGQKIMNPNDPMENPNLHLHGQRDIADQSRAGAHNNGLSEPSKGKGTPWNPSKGAGETSRGGSTSPLQQNTPPQQKGSPSVPKFGSWEEMNSTSGEGYTLAFDGLMRNKAEAKAKLPPIPTEPVKTPERNKSNRSNRSAPSFITKLLGCFIPTAKD